MASVTGTDVTGGSVLVVVEEEEEEVAPTVVALLVVATATVEATDRWARWPSWCSARERNLQRTGRCG